MSEIKYDRFDDSSRNWEVDIPLHLGQVACRPQGRDKYRATYKSVKALIIPTPNEIRIPYVSSEERGHFKEFMDQLVEDLDQRTIKGTNVTAEGAMSALSERIGDDNAREIRDAIHGFEEVTEDWDGMEVVCLVGEWNPDR